jgi:hypothetical protein
MQNKNQEPEQYFVEMLIKNELPPQGKKVVLKLKDGKYSEGCYTNKRVSIIYTYQYTLQINTNEIMAWLKPISITELLSCAFDAGWLNGHADGAGIDNLTNHPDKETYLQSLK